MPSSAWEPVLLLALYLLLDLAAGSGLRGIADRVRALGGTLTASSNPNGSGSSIEITLPCTS